MLRHLMRYIGKLRKYRLKAYYDSMVPVGGLMKTIVLIIMYVCFLILNNKMME